MTANRGAARGWRGLLLGGTLAALAFTAFSPALDAGFQWDDDLHFLDDPQMHEGLGAVWSKHRFYFPLTSTVWWCLHAAVGFDPYVFHLVNVVLHALNGVLLWRLVRRLGVPGAWAVAAVWVIHPVTVQSVAWATELENCLSGCFYLLALIAWTREDGPRARPWYVAAVVAAVLAMLSKTSTVSLPVVLVVVDLVRRVEWSPRRALRLVPFVVAAAAAGVWTLRQRLDEGRVTGPDWDLSVAERAATAGRCVWFYLGKVFFPRELTFVYPRWTASASSALDWLPLVALLALAAALLMLRRRGGRPALLALTYFVVSLAPVLHVFRIYYARYSYVADHWQYLASMGAVAWAVGSAAWLVERSSSPRRRAIGIGALVVVLALLAVKTWRQALHYHDEESLWSATLEDDPTAWIALNNLARIRSRQGRDAEALELVNRGLARTSSRKALDPMLLNKAIILGKLERHRDALEILLDLQERTGRAELRIAKTLARLGRNGEAGTWFRRAVAGEDRAAALVPTGLFFMSIGRPADAVEFFEVHLATAPGDVDVHMFLADAYAFSGRTKDAVARAKLAVESARAAGRDDVVRVIERRVAEYRRMRRR